MKISILTAFSLFVVIVACTPQETDVTFDAQSSEAETASSASHSPSIDEPSSTPKSTQASQSNYKEFLFNMDQPQDVNFIAVSPDGKRLAYTVPLPGKDLFLVDGELIEEFEFLGEPTFSPDSQKTAVVARFDEKAFWIVDGERGNVYDEVGYLAFSPTSNRWGHLGMDGEQTFLVIDGEEIRQHDNIQFWAFSPDSQHFAYVADEGAKQVLVVDGSEQALHDSITYFCFSPDSQRLAYIVAEQDGSFAVIDNVPGKWYDEVRGFTFSPDSKRVAYIASEDERDFVVIDGIEHRSYSSLSWRFTFSQGNYSPVFSRYPPRYDMTSLIFSPDSNKLAYIARDDDKAYLVVDEVEIEDFADEVVFSPDGQRLAYTSLGEDGWSVVVDGVRGSTYEYMPGALGVIAYIAFSRDSQHVAYIAGSNKSGWTIVFDGEEIHRYDDVTMFTMSLDGGHIVYLAYEDDNAFMVVDQDERESFDQIYLPTSFELDESAGFHYLAINETGAFHYLARKGDEVYLIRDKLE